MGLYLILMGAQGAGKGLQAEYISKTYGIPHISTGDVFRAMRTRTDALATRVQEIITSGQLVDDDTTNEVVADRLSQPDAQNGAILDGYPRNQAQADFLSDFLAQRNEKISTVLLLNLDLYIAFKRAFGRVKAANGDSYNIYFRNEGIKVETIEDPEKRFPPRLEATLESTGEVLERRDDDANAAAVIKRIDLYVESTQPLIDYFQAKGLLHTIDAAESVETVSAEIKAYLDSLH